MNDDYVYIYSVSGQLAGDMIRILLESMDIPAITLQESAGVTYGLTVGPLGEVKVYVPPDKVDEANAVIRAMEEGNLNSPSISDQSEDYPEYKDNKWNDQDQYKD